MKKLKCNIFGHSWLYNFPVMANKRICKTCNTKMELNLSNFNWHEIDSFDPILGTDKEIKKRWISYTR